MTSVFDILSFPKTSDALTAIRPTILDVTVDEGSAPPARKVARLTAESDSASASRSKPAKSVGGSFQIQIVGEYKSKPPAGDKQLSLLRRCIRTILAREPGPNDTIPATYEGIYNACRSVVTVSHLGQDLYNTLKIELEQSIGQLAKMLLASTEKDTVWLSSFNAAFKWFEYQLTLLKSLLTYLDQVYVVQEKGTLNVRDLAYFLVSERIFGSAQVMERLRSGVKDWLTWERKNRRDHRDRAIIPALIQHLLRHHQYSALEEYYITVTRDFYIEESAAKATEFKDNPKAFFNNARARIEEEAARSKAVLPVPTWGIIRENTERALWGGRLEWVASTTLAGYMEGKDFDTLAIMYTLFSRVNGTKALCNAFGAFIRLTVSNIVKEADRDDEMVQRLLDFKELADTTVSSSFLCDKVAVASTPSTNIPPPPTPVASVSTLPQQPDQQFLYALTDSFTTGFKARRSKPAEMIAKYLDKAMRKGQKDSTDTEFQDLLDRVLALYRFTDDKDVFRTFYHRSLAKRLLLEKSASDDFEKAMLKKLKEKYDPEFGMGEDMFKDLALSRESMREYHSRLAEDSPGQKLSAMVLQRSAWPFSVQKHNVDLPPNMQAELTQYADYYKSKHSGHVLDWDHSLGTVTLKARFTAGIKELNVSMYQALVLLLFNDETDLSYEDIKEQTGMEEAELKRTLQSLACGKKKVLKKVPVGKEVDDTDVFKYNPDFRDPQIKVHINSIQAKVSPEESKRTNASIEDDRKHYLDAAIVRVMKARKEMTYEQLKAATIDAVKGHFVPLVETIKRRIDSLVETEYLERSPTDRNKYLYIA
ncbi:hypothetical protein GALMADRAFT_255498 [Galerina marginata CBS 339.88]|uniref:Cullin family profile domain-containing protein n=1 Tax=Galerina marginata (strain CBS 339.88) TaxID=685588 RepID=A0A067SGR9_GALM3|nr:hypothetical protein GALMADRAFT_255498 [Galerina marginata CBS 339.88]